MAAARRTAKKADTPVAEPVEGKEDKESKSPGDVPAQEEDAKTEASPPKKTTKKLKKKSRRTGGRTVKRAGKQKKSN